MFITKARFDQMQNRIQKLESIVKLDTQEADVTFKIINRLMKKIDDNFSSYHDFSIMFSVRLYIFSPDEPKTSDIIFYHKTNEVARWKGDYTNRDNFIRINSSPTFMKDYLSGKIDKELDAFIKEKNDTLDALTLELALLD